MRRGGKALADFRRHLLDGALSLGENIDDLCTPSVAERRRHRREGVVEGALGLPSAHIFKLILE